MLVIDDDLDLKRLQPSFLAWLDANADVGVTDELICDWFGETTGAESAYDSATLLHTTDEQGDYLKLPLPDWWLVYRALIWRYKPETYRQVIECIQRHIAQRPERGWFGHFCSNILEIEAAEFISRHNSGEIDFDAAPMWRTARHLRPDPVQELENKIRGAHSWEEERAWIQQTVEKMLHCTPLGLPYVRDDEVKGFEYLDHWPESDRTWRFTLSLRLGMMVRDWCAEFDESSKELFT